MKKIIKIYKISLFVICVLAFSFSVQAQNADWVRVQSNNGEFSIEMPKNLTYFYDKDGFSLSQGGNRDHQYSEMQMLNGSSGKTVMIVEIYRVASPKNQLSLMLEQLNVNSSKFDVPKGFNGKQYEIKKVRDYNTGKDIEVSFTSRFITSKNYLYVISVGNRGQKTKEFERFLSSNRFGGNQTEGVKI